MADNTENDVILAIDVKYEDAIEGIAKYTQNINDLRKANADLKKDLQNGKISQENYNKAIEVNNILITQNSEKARILRKEIQNNIKTEREQEGSLKSLRAQLSNVTKTYDEMSRAEREGAKGKEFLGKIQALQVELRKAEDASGRFKRNVGNYQDTFLKAAAGGNQFAASLLQTATSAGTAGGAFKALGSQVAAFGKTLLALLANPIVLIIAAIAAAVALLSKAFQTNEENTNKLSVVMSKISGVFSYLLKVLEPIASFLVDVLIKAFDQLAIAAEFSLNLLSSTLEKLGFDKASKAVSDFTSELKEQTEAAGDLVKTQQLLTKLNREQVTRGAEIEAQLKNVTSAMNKEGISISEKIKLLRQEAKLNKEKARMALKIALATKQAAELEIQLHGRTKEALDALATATAGVTQATAALGEAYQKENANIAAANKEAVAKAKERASQELEAARALEDSLLALIEDTREKQRKTIEASYDRRIEDLNKRLKEEKNLTQKAREDINTTIANLEKQKNNELAKLEEEQVKINYDIALKNIENKLAALKAESQEALNLRIDTLQKQRDIELLEAEKTGADKAAINAKYDKKIADETLNAAKEANKKLAEEQKKNWQNQILEAELNAKGEVERQRAVTALKIAQLEEEKLQIQQKEDESDAAFLNRKLELDLKLKELREQQNQQIVDQQVNTLGALSSIAGGMTDLFESLAEDNEAFASFAKAMALFQIGLDTAKALTAGIAAAQQAGPFPANLVAIATTVATVLANIAKAKKYLTSSKEPKASFATGGLVTGAGSGTSDNISARLSNGESVLTARATSMFTPIISAFNQIGGGVPISTRETAAQVMGEEMLTRAFARAIQDMPNPIVSVQDINTVSDRIDVIENIQS